MKVKKVLIIAGGTCGHVFPALAVAQYLRTEQIDVFWMGTTRGLEGEILSQTAFPFYALKISGLRRKSLLQRLVAGWQLLHAFFQAFFIIYKNKPDVVLAMGGYASGPGGLAAWVLHKKLILHEQNTAMGLTNRLLSRFATRVLTGFPNTSGVPDLKKVLYVGNPVRDDISKIELPDVRFQNRKDEPLHVLVLGGSQGAAALNKIVPESIALLKDKPMIWHVAGPKQVTETRDIYRAKQIDAQVDPFVTDMAMAYAWADVVICRAGALTIAELMAAGVASILVPYPFAADQHQMTNACFLSDQGAAILIEEKDLIPKKLVIFLTEWMGNKVDLLHMAQAARSLYQANSLEKIARVIGVMNH